MSWLTIQGVKALLVLVMIFINWAALVVWFLLLHAFAYINQNTSVIRSSYFLFIAEDHLVNTIMSGHFETTISSELGNMQTKGSRTGELAASVVNWIFWKITGDPKQKDHCRISMQKADVFTFHPFRAIVGTLLFQATNAFVIYALVETYWRT